MKDFRPSPFDLPEWLDAISLAMVPVAEELENFSEESWRHPHADGFFEECRNGLGLLESLFESRLRLVSSLTPDEFRWVESALQAEADWARSMALKARHLFRNETLRLSLTILADSLEDLLSNLKLRGYAPSSYQPELAQRRAA